MGDDENPFDRYEIDPRASPEVITERFRELVADAPEHERDALRAAWDALTMHPESRVRAAFFAHPETRPPLGSPPKRKRPAPAPEVEPSLFGLLVLPELCALLPPPSRAPGSAEAELVSSDPVLREK